MNQAKAGITYKSGDITGLCEAIVKVYETPKCYATNGLIFAEKHDWDIIANDLLKLYAELS